MLSFLFALMLLLAVFSPFLSWGGAMTPKQRIIIVHGPPTQGRGGAVCRKPGAPVMALEENEK